MTEETANFTRSEALQHGFRQLETQHDCPGSEPLREAQALLEHALRLDAVQLNLDPDKPLTAAEQTAFQTLLDRRCQHEPLAHLLGWAPFLDFELKVTRDTLIPRPATETVAQVMLARLAETPGALAIDVGTGSGALAIAAARSRPAPAENADPPVWATDLSPAALAVAEVNAEELFVSDRIAFHRSDLLDALLPQLAELAAADRPLIIVANLPYLPDSHWPELAPEIADHEPRTALTSGPAGLDHYRRLIHQLAVLPSTARLTLTLEILPEQYEPLSQELALNLSLESQPIHNHQQQIVGLIAEKRV
jgi:release factor glutamine methyltransferase